MTAILVIAAILLGPPALALLVFALVDGRHRRRTALQLHHAFERARCRQDAAVSPADEIAAARARLRRLDGVLGVQPRAISKPWPPNRKRP